MADLTEMNGKINENGCGTRGVGPVDREMGHLDYVLGGSKERQGEEETNGRRSRG